MGQTWVESRSLRAVSLDISYWGAKRAREHVGCGCPTVLLPLECAQAVRCSLVFFAAHKGTFTPGLQSCCGSLRAELISDVWIYIWHHLPLTVYLHTLFLYLCGLGLHGLLSALEGVSRLQSNRAAQAGFPPSRVMPGSVWIKHSPGVPF